MSILWKNNKRGVSAIEILVVIAVVGIVFGSILSLATLSLKLSISIKKTSQANFLTQEIMEAVRNFRDGISWDNDDPEDKYDGLGIVTTGIAYHLEQSSDIPAKWMLIQGEETVNDFSRKVVFDDVYRESLTDNITTSGGYLDSNTKKVTATISWESKQIEIISYLTNWAE